MTLELCPTGPWDGPHLLGFIGQRAVVGVEGSTRDGGFARVLDLDGAPVLIGIRPVTTTPSTGDGAAARRGLSLTVVGTNEETVGAVAPEAIRRVRRLLDLERDGRIVDAALADDPLLSESVRLHPGRRSPGAADAAETVTRAILGQQVSVRRARDLLTILAAEHGSPLPSALRDHPLSAEAGLERAFPSPEALADLDPATLPMPATRATALVTAARLIADGRLALEREADPAEVRARLLEIHGIGPWTADYVLLRGLGHPDVFLPADLGVRRALEALGVRGSAADLAEVAEHWSPWRSYALHRLWSPPEPGPTPPI